ncbi:hypothetical protein RRG08_020763 [Elysia crispata]|uniref:Peptidyl-prolyl cis-trans isomerase n=1 Tax=Elysia crispata TaxID=231223 RepID=A0AAE1ARZ2_9GAST|nr:hypothetical protein RRG08_020763 [Elysia crispata]
MSVIIETSIGDFTVDLYTDERPRCCLNFLKLCKIKFYNFSLFHSVQSNLVAQTGDPTATGRGGESIFAKLYGEQARFFDMEVSPRIKHTQKGLVSMVNNGSGMHGSQFFITLAENLDYLDGKHTVFGEVAEGFEIIDKLNNTFCGEDNRPHQDIRIYHTIILDDPFDDPENLVIPMMSPGPTEEMLNSDHIPCDADIDEDKGKTEAELREIEAEKEAKANTQILEMVGDLPDADVAPPENVLFVCKLNPVTTAEDLEIIFSRFGKIVSCDVIKDNKTGESLQYAFIEFDNPQSCENAYFKMDNVLIDDRRIHVDFSQSVSKLKWKGKGKGVDILSSGDAPVYVLKDQQRRDNNYDLVYEEDVPDINTSKKKKQKDDSGEKKRQDDWLKGKRETEPMQTYKQYSSRHDKERQQKKGWGDLGNKGKLRNAEKGRKEYSGKERSPERRKREYEDGSRSPQRGRNEHSESNLGKGDHSKSRKENHREYNRQELRDHKPKRRSWSHEAVRRPAREEQDSDSEQENQRGGKKSKKSKKKHDRDLSSDEGNRIQREYQTDSDSSLKEDKIKKRRKEERKRQHSENESEIESKKQKSKKSKKHKKKASSDSDDYSLKSKKKKKKSKHNRSDSDG